jgi:hypothetical protein
MHASRAVPSFVRAAALLASAAVAPTAAPLRAQDASASTTAHEPPEIVRMTIAGPAAWRARLGPTNLGAMLATEAAERIWRGYLARADARLRAGRPAAAPGGDPLGSVRARLIDYAGTVHVVCWLEQAEDAVHVARWSAALVAEPDGHTDLAAMAAECRASIDHFADRASEPWRVVAAGAPRVHDGRLLLVLADDDDRAAATARAERIRGAPLERQDVVRVETRLPELLGLLRDHPLHRELAADVLGVTTGCAALTLGAVGPRVALTLALHGEGIDRGLVGAVWPVRPAGPSTLAMLAPEGAALQLVWRTDLGAVWETWLRTGGSAVERAMAWKWDEAAYRARVAQRFGGDLGRDVLAHVGDELMLVAGLPVPRRDDPRWLPWQSLCLVARVRDAGRHEAVLRARLGRFGHVVIGGDVVCLALSDAALPIAAGIVERADAAVGAAPPSGTQITGTGTLQAHPVVLRELQRMLALASVLAGGWDVTDLLVPARDVDRWHPLLLEHRLGSIALESVRTAGELQLRVLW